MQWLKHAFAVDPPGPAVPDPAEAELLDRLLAAVVRRGLAAPALVALETVRPLNMLGAQALHFLAPLLDVLTDRRSHVVLARFLEHRGSIEYLCRRLEYLEQSDAAAVAAGTPPATAPHEKDPP